LKRLFAQHTDNVVMGVWFLPGISFFRDTNVASKSKKKDQ
jgi:hypothetical protein